MYLINKPIGIDGYTFVKTYIKNLEKKKFVICGKLDPMAKGVLLVLFDEECKLMNSYLLKDKIYEWFIIWGISTDTTDTLGYITDIIDINFDENLIQKELCKFIGTYKQDFHKYSSINLISKITGERKPLWRWSKENRLDEIDIPNKEVIVKYIKLLYSKQISFNDIKKPILYNLNKITGDFRQDIIKKQWLSFKKNKLYISKFKAHVSTGYYIRQFVEDFGNHLGYLGIALDIDRLEIII